MKLIDKDTLVAELKKRIRDYWSDSENTMGIYPHALEEVIKYTDTFEAKEVDLEKEYKDFLKCDDGRSMFETAKHFFELGINTSNQLTWEDVKEICIQSVLVEIDLGGKVSDERHYTEVLKRFKAQKGK